MATIVAQNEKALEAFAILNPGYPIAMSRAVPQMPVASVVPMLPVAAAVPVTNASKRKLDEIVITAIERAPLPKRAAFREAFDSVAVPITAYLTDSKIPCTETVNRLSAQITELEQQRNDQDAALAKETSEKYNLEEEIERLKDDDLRVELEKANNGLQTYREQIADQERSHQQTRFELDQMRRDFNDADTANASLTRDLQDAVAARDHADAALREHRQTAAQNPVPQPAAVPHCVVCYTDIFSIAKTGGLVKCDNDECSEFLCKTCVSDKVASDIPTLTDEGIKCTNNKCKCVLPETSFMPFLAPDISAKYIRKMGEVTAAKESVGCSDFVKTPCGCGDAMRPSFDGCGTIKCNKCPAYWDAITFTPFILGEFDPNETETDLYDRAHRETARKVRENNMGDSYFIGGRHAPAIERLWMKYFIVGKAGRDQILAVFPKFDTCTKKKLQEMLTLMGLPTTGYGMA